MKNKLSILVSVLIIALSFGCGDHDDHDHNHDAGHQNTVDEEGCTHIKNGPFVDVKAGNTATLATEIKSDHKAYRVTLLGQTGYVEYKASEKGELLIFVDQSINITLKDDMGTEVSPEKKESSIKACVEVKNKYTFDLDTVGIYTLILSSNSTTKVTLVLELDDGHNH